MNLNLLNLIFYHFLGHDVTHSIVFHCWHVKALHEFYGMTLNFSIYVKFVNLELPMQEVLKNDERKSAVFLPLDCPSSRVVLDIASEFWRFSAQYHWLIYDANANVYDFQTQFSNKNLSIDADLTYAHSVNATQVSNDVTFRLYDVYNNGKHIGGRLNMTQDREVVCNDTACSLKSYLSDLHKRSKFGNRPTMNDVNMRVSLILTQLPLNSSQQDILNFLSTNENIIVENIGRFGFVTIQLMQDILKCKYLNLWSETDSDGGVIGEICNHNAELISSPYLMSKERLDKSVPIMVSHDFRSVCVFRTEHNSGVLKNEVFFEPFSPMVWFMFSGTILACTLLLWFTFFVERTTLQQIVHNVPSLLSTLVLSFGMACSQGSALVPNSAGGRITFLTLALLCFMMYNYYTSIVVSSLLGSPVKSNTKTVDQLADSSLKVAMEFSAYTQTYLKTQSLPEIKHFVKRKVQTLKNPADLWMPIVNGVMGIKDKPNFAYVFEASTGYYLVQRYFKDTEICDLNEINFRTGTLYHHVNRNSTYRDFFRYRLMRILETGIHNKHARHWTRKQPSCYSNNNLIEVGLEYTASLFIFILCSYIIVGTTLLIEIGLYRYINKVQK